MFEWFLDWTGAGRGPAPVPRLLVATASVVLAACSLGGAASAPGSTPNGEAALRVIRVDLLDFRFEPARLDVTVGESVRFIAANDSDLPHELFIGTATAQEAHNALHASAAPDAQDQLEVSATGVYVPARGVAQFTMRFDQPGELMMGCHLVGHFESGMFGLIEVRQER